MTEAELQAQVASYLRQQYPDVMFHSDFGSGVKLTPRQATMQKRQNGGRSKWPDMFIAQIRFCWIADGKCERVASFDAVYERWKKAGKPVDGFQYGIEHGLFLELKKDGTRLKKKNGDWATEHIAAQAKMLDELYERGYAAEFVVGFDEAKKIIDEYLGGQNEEV